MKRLASNLQYNSSDDVLLLRTLLLHVYTYHLMSVKMYSCEFKCMSVIQPHQDGPAYFPVVAILSLGSPVVMDFTPHSRLTFCTNDVKDTNSDGGTSDIEKEKWLGDHHPFSVALMPCSLLIFKEKAYSGQYLWLSLLPVCYLRLP